MEMVNVKHNVYGHGKIISYQPFSNFWIRFQGQNRDGRKIGYTIMLADKKENLEQMYIGDKTLQEVVDTLKPQFIQMMLKEKAESLT